MRGSTATRWGWIAALCAISNAQAQVGEEKCDGDVDTRSIGDHRFVPLPSPVDFGSAFAPTYLEGRVGIGAQSIKTDDASGWTVPAFTTFNGGLQLSGGDVDFGIEGGLGVSSAFGDVLIDLSAEYAFAARFAAGPSFRLGRTRLGVHLGWTGAVGQDVSLRSYLEDQLQENGPPQDRVPTALVPTSRDDLSASIAWATVFTPSLSLQGAWRVDYARIARDVWIAKDLHRQTTNLTRLSSAIGAGPSISWGKSVIATALGLTLPRVEIDDPLRRIYTLNMFAGVEVSWLLSELRLGVGAAGRTQLSSHHDRPRTTADGASGSPTSDAKQPTLRTSELDVVLRVERVF